jgi:short-subunit dehydrogenase
MEEQIMVITGASSGVGEALTAHFAGQGYRVCAIGRSREKLERVKKNDSSNIDVFPCDISKVGEVERVFEKIVENHRHIDVLINNAALFEMRAFADTGPASIDLLVDTNLKGTMYCTHFTVPHMIRRKKGKIINIASVAGIHGIPRQSIYCATKQGMVGFSDTIAQELLRHGIHVMTVCPGGIDTPLWNTEKNPYPGDVSKITTTGEICDLISFMLRVPDHTLFKRCILFPMIEWH